MTGPLLYYHLFRDAQEIFKSQLSHVPEFKKKNIYLYFQNNIMKIEPAPN